ncbi:MAG: 4-hydroxy-3-methylbut-2-enyl diphosphate reductase [Clostridiales bacterium]|nr:4-hydroxy-3-methylbut-2-enyl diphosphate reductase [Clostridiales bacterium]
MIVLKGKHGGFCFGVKRAVSAAEKLTGEGNYVLGEIIHNETVISRLEKLGIKTIYSIDDIAFRRGDKLLIRTHGEPKSTFIKAAEKGVEIIDFTCPFVKEIQNIVERHYKEGYTIAIIGNANHPEIKGINGWCNGEAIITESSEVLSNLKYDKLCVVVQTTYSEEKFDKIIENFKFSKAKTVDIFKTICYTTTKRQKEAEILSKRCDAVLVLGGANSNNTDKLFDICKANCENVYRLIDPADFNYEKIKSYNKVGIVMGASTPIEQFQEVISNMEKITEEIITTETVASEVQEEVKEVVETAAVKEPVVASEKSEMEKAFNNIKPSKDFRIGQVVSAYISSAKDDGLTLSLKNSKKDFELPKDEILGEYNKDAYLDKIGQEMRVMVIAKNPLKFSEKSMEKVLKEEAEIEEIKAGKIFEATITATNKGGLTGKYGSYQVFIPASQIKMGFVKDLEKYVGKNLRLKAEKVESRGARRQIVGSQRVILEAEKAERDAIKAQKEAEFFGSIQEGDVVIGTPVRFAAFGAFVDVNGFDCLAHISDLSWTGCKECADVLELGKQYEFKILKIDEEAKRVSIGYKQLQAKPWDTVLERYNVGDVVKGNVVRLVSFGAFVEIEKGIDGLVHVSQISNQWLENPVTALQVGQEVEAKIIDINPEKEKMTLSIKALLPEEPKSEQEDDTKGKGKKRKAKAVEEDDVAELREWKDDNSGDGGVSIAEMLGNSEN